MQIKKDPLDKRPSSLLLPISKSCAVILGKIPAIYVIGPLLDASNDLRLLVFSRWGSRWKGIAFFKFQGLLGSALSLPHSHCCQGPGSRQRGIPQWILEATGPPDLLQRYPTFWNSAEFPLPLFAAGAKPLPCPISQPLPFPRSRTG